MPVGNTSVSALVRSGNSAAAALAANQDAQWAQDWKFGPQDQAQHDAYQAYLAGRVKTLQSVGTVADATKALSFQTTGMDVARQFRSGQIQQAALDVQEGNGTLSDKVDKLRSLASQAYASGDNQNGQALEGQYNSALLQLQAQGEANAKAAIAGNAAASAAHLKDQYTNPIKEITQKMEAATAAFSKDPKAAGGQDKYQSSIANAYNMIQSIRQGAQNDKALTSDQLDTIQAAQDKLDQVHGGTYSVLANPNVQHMISQGQRVFTTKTDKLTGTTTLAVNQEAVDNMKQGVDAQGNVVDNLSANPKLAAHLKTVSGGGTATMQIETNHGTHEVTIQPDSNVINGKATLSKDYGHYIDPETGRTVDVALTGPQAGSHVLGENRDANGNNVTPNTFQQLAQDTENAKSPIDQGLNTAGLPGLGDMAKGVGTAFGQNAGVASRILEHAMSGGSGILDALMHPDHILQPQDPNSYMQGVSHFFANPVQGVIDASKGLAQQRQAKFDSLAALNAKQLQAAQQAYQAANSATLPANAHAAYTAAHEVAPAPVTAGGNNIQKILTQPVPTNPNGTVNAPAAATKLVTGLGYGNF